MENSERGYLLPIDLMKAYDINTQIDIVYGSCNLYRQEIADILYSPDGTTQLLQLMADQLNAVKDEFEKYKRNSVPLAGYELDEAEELTLPEVAPELYKNRLNKKENPLEFLKRVWGKYLDAGVLYQDDLKGKNGMDGALIDAIRAYCTHHNLVASDYLPPPKSARISTELLEDIPLDKISARQYFTKAKRARRNG